MLILYTVTGYLLVGVVFALLFVTRLIHRVDEASIGSPWSFKLLIFPGCIILWPVLMKKYFSTKNTRQHD